ncbi:MAG: hypothetical protein ACOC93_04365 [Planctomycetota bacterium]
MNSANGPRSTVRIVSMEVSRFILGHNPPCGCSHMSRDVDVQMKAYYTAENVHKLWFDAEQAGLRTLLIRGDYRCLDWVETYRRKGGELDVICQTASEMHDVFQNIRVIAAAGIPTIYHHGSQTDQFWAEGRIDEVNDYLKCMRDCGVNVGMATHQPEIIEYAEEKGWDVDFYMACFYNISRKPRHSSIVTGQCGYDQEEYLDEDRARMAQVIQQVDKPCLGFKILAAGRNCTTQEDVREAFRYAYANIKPTDAVVVGLFPRDLDQLTVDLQYAEDACEAIVQSAE